MGLRDLRVYQMLVHRVASILILCRFGLEGTHEREQIDQAEAAHETGSVVENSLEASLLW